MSVQSEKANGTTANGVHAGMNRAAGLWIEKMQSWNSSLGLFGEAMVPAIDAYASMLGEYREVVKTTTEQIEENMKILRNGMQEFRRAGAPADYIKAGDELREKLTQQNVAAGQKMVNMVGAIASRRFQAQTEMAAAVMRKSKAQ